MRPISCRSVRLIALKDVPEFNNSVFLNLLSPNPSKFINNCWLITNNPSVVPRRDGVSVTSDVGCLDTIVTNTMNLALNDDARMSCLATLGVYYWFDVL